MPPELPGEEWRVVWLGHGSKLLLGAVAGLCFTAHTEALFGVHTAGQLVPALEEEACANHHSVRTSKGGRHALARSGCSAQVCTVPVW